MPLKKQSMAGTSMRKRRGLPLESVVEPITVRRFWVESGEGFSSDGESLESCTEVMITWGIL